MEATKVTTELENEINRPLPDLSLGEKAISFLSKILLDGGADEPAFENGKSEKISERLRSGKDGFFDKSKFPAASF